MTAKDLRRLDPWFDDGNIVLVAQGKAFRVHRSVLGANSEVFRDMITIPHPGDAKEGVIEGCPVVPLQDASGDVQIMLKAFYDRSYAFHDGKPMPFATLAAFLRLGDKYAVRQLSKEALDHLSLDESRLELAGRISDPKFDGALFPRVSDIDPCYFALANLAAETGCFSTLAIVIYYHCVACPASHISDGYISAGTRSQLNQTSNLLRCLFGYRGPLMTWQDEWNKFLNSPEYARLKYEAEVKELWDAFPVHLGLGHWKDFDKDFDI